MFSFLPESVQNALNRLSLRELSEIRLRKDAPCRVRYGERLFYLTPFGISEERDFALRPTGKELEDVLFAASNRSMYSVSDELKQGFLTAEGGVRIGIGGVYSTENGVVQSVRNVTSLNIRIPHEVTDCTRSLAEKIYRTGFVNTLLVAPPGLGKTTALRDLCRQIARLFDLTLLIADERGEITLDGTGDTGENADRILYAPKAFAFSVGVRTMRPDVVVTDELVTEAEGTALAAVLHSGVGVLACVHGASLADASAMQGVKTLLLQKAFGRIVLFGERVGKTVGIYDGEGHIL